MPVGPGRIGTRTRGAHVRMCCARLPTPLTGRDGHVAAPKPDLRSLTAQAGGAVRARWAGHSKDITSLHH